MPIFDYRAKTKEGKTVEGAVEAPDEKTAAGVLLEKGLFILHLRERKHLFSWIERPAFLNRITTKDLVVFSRQLSVMVSANLTLVEALRILIKQTENPRLRIIISEIADEVDGGASLSQALARYPKVFDHFFVNMVRSGETSGKLDEVLNYLADQKERDYELMSKIKGAMVYPVFIVGALIVVGAVMMIVVVPRLTQVLLETGQELPIATRVLIGTSSFMQQYWLALLIGITAVGVGFRIVYDRSEEVRIAMDHVRLKLPVFGRLLRHICLVRFTRSLSTLLEGGVPLTFALEVTAGVVGNHVYEGIIQQTVQEVKDGHSLTTIFEQSKEVPSMMTNMLKAGEDTGKIEIILKRLTDFYTREINNLVDNLVSLIEPVIMIVLGVAVGVMVAAIILPMYNLASGF